jgi:hypothetical protein
VPEIWLALNQDNSFSSGHLAGNYSCSYSEVSNYFSEVDNCTFLYLDSISPKENNYLKKSEIFIDIVSKNPDGVTQ